MLRVRTNFTGMTGAPYLSTFYFHAASEDAAAAQAAVTATRDFWNAFTTVWLPTFSYQVDGAVDVLNEETGQQFDQLTAAGATGVGVISGSELLPPATQGLIRWNTNIYVAGRRVRGRTFLPGLTESSSANGVPGGQLVSTTAPNAVTALLGNATVDLMVWSRPKATSPARPGKGCLVTAAALVNEFAVLRSRRD